VVALGLKSQRKCWCQPCQFRGEVIEQVRIVRCSGRDLALKVNCHFDIAESFDHFRPVPLRHSSTFHECSLVSLLLNISFLDKKSWPYLDRP
jgi:hypothetical protein